ncbi:hypothetical protein ACUXK4_002866 [Methylorubrum extorquens]
MLRTEIGLSAAIDATDSYFVRSAESGSEAMLSRNGTAERALSQNAILIGAVVAALLTLFLFVYALSSGEGPAQKIQMIYQSALVMAGLIGLPLAIWRSWTAHQQFKTTQKQVSLLEQGAEADRLQKGTELLESEKLIVRIAGIAILRSVAVEKSHKFNTEAFRVLNAFASSASKEQPVYPSGDKLDAMNEDELPKSPEDLVEAFNALRDSSLVNKMIISELDLRGVMLREVHLHPLFSFGITFRDCFFSKCSVEKNSDSEYRRCHFYDCDIELTDPEMTYYLDCKFSRSRLFGVAREEFKSINDFYECAVDDLQTADAK